MMVSSSEIEDNSKTPKYIQLVNLSNEALFGHLIRFHARYGEKNLLLNKFLKYRHYDVNAAVQDAHWAIRYIRANAEKWGIDPNHIGIGGFSAGGHLSLNSALTKEFDEDLPADNIQKFIFTPLEAMVLTWVMKNAIALTGRSCSGTG